MRPFAHACEGAPIRWQDAARFGALFFVAFFAPAIPGHPLASKWHGVDQRRLI